MDIPSHQWALTGDRTLLETREKNDDAARTGKGIADTQSTGDGAKEAAFEVIGTVKEKVRDVAASASGLVGKATDKAQEWASSVGDAAVRISHQAHRAASATVEKAGDLSQDITALIRRYPIPALLVGVGAGFLLGQALSHRSSKRV
jgi:ElaB/YqjD/DUF883 family membrane-anchored ribosome-binding protein